jgi:chaperonin cofactor prefoldin
MMGSGDTNVWLLQGESYFDTAEDDAIQYCENQVQELQQKVEKLEKSEATIIEEQGELKVILYNRFGKSINLEDS